MQHLLPKELRSFRYYERKLPLYLRNDELFVEHFKIWYEVCMGKGDEGAIKDFCGVSPSADLILYLLDIYDKDFLSTIQSLKNYTGRTDIIDDLGRLFGLNRQFSFGYKEEITDTQLTYVQVDLTDAEYLLLIKAQIIRNYCNGTYEQARQYYSDAGLDILPLNNDVYNAAVIAYLNESDDLTDTMKKLFKAGLLTIEHVGITYQYVVTDLLNILMWNDNELVAGSKNVWDEGRWAA